GPTDCRGERYVRADDLASGVPSRRTDTTASVGVFQEQSMSRITAVDRNAAGTGVRKNFDAIEKQLGLVPNMMRTMAQSPVILEGYLGLSGALSRGLLPTQLQERLALAIAEANACDYCLSAHSLLGHGAGLSDDQVDA